MLYLSTLDTPSDVCLITVLYGFAWLYWVVFVGMRTGWRRNFRVPRIDD